MANLITKAKDILEIVPIKNLSSNEIWEKKQRCRK